MWKDPEREVVGWKPLIMEASEYYLGVAAKQHGDSVIIIMRCSPDRENNKGGTAD